MTRKTELRFTRLLLYGLSFLIGAQSAVVVYFNSSFLESHGLSEGSLGFLYVAGSLGSILLLFLAHHILRSLGALRTAISAGIALIIFFLTLAFTHNTPFVIAAFVLALVSQVLLWFCLDIFLEHYTCSESGTGSVRSSALTASNFAYVISPIAAGALLEAFGFGGMYITSSLILVLAVGLMAWKFRSFQDPTYHKLEVRPALRKLRRRVHIRHIFSAAFFLYFFYSIMTIYMPLYLQGIGFSLAQIGIIFSIMILPFAILQYPLGHFVDKKIGEKEMLVAGFLLLAFATATIPFITSTLFVVWVGILFATRVGAATVEIMSEIYFFKHVDDGDIDTISIFRILFPLAYIAGPLVGIVILYVADMRFIFFFLSLFLLTGVYAGIKLRDTK